ncbi:hypothetical protein RND81_02G057200 [Saponaria officinalis]|uniref:AAA+ ATPase domain-containing protein n=1 Tax=Saponaria officinalis TaxID=3572 RepID=A0AAW1MRN2_SAPOF
MDKTSATTTTKFIPFFPSTSSIFAAYASASATITLLQQAYYQFVPKLLHDHLSVFLHRILRRRSTTMFTLLVEEDDGVKTNPLFEALEAYLCHKVLTTSATTCLKATTDSITNSGGGAPVTLNLAQDEEFKEVVDGVEVCWRFNCIDPRKARRNYLEADTQANYDRIRFVELCFLKDHKDFVLKSYIPMVMEIADKIMNKERVLKIWTLKYCGSSYEKKAKWESVKFNHPSTFDSLALDPEIKSTIIHDLDLFLERKDFYRKVGRAWKRGYLLYGPPGTGKSSLIAAIANYLKFDVYDLQLMHILGDDMLRKLLLSTTNRSILVIEDIDCSMGLPKKRTDDEDEDDDSDDDAKSKKSNEVWNPVKISLSGLLNFIDGLWSSCGDERIIIFTTNHKDRIDPALLRPGRMDMHVHMSYLGMTAFKKLASNYLDKSVDSEPHRLYEQIEGMIQTTNVTPAEVAEELMKSKDVNVVLDGVVALLKRKRVEFEAEEIEKEKVRKIRKIKKEEKAKKKELLQALVDKAI